MIKGAIYRLMKAHKDRTHLGWDEIKFMDVVHDRTIEYMTNPLGYRDSEDEKNTSKTIRTEYKYICLCDGTLVVLYEDQIYEDMDFCYELVNGGDL